MNENVKELIVEETINGAEEAVEAVAKAKIGFGGKVLIGAVVTVVVLAAVKGGKKLVAKIKDKKAAKKAAAETEEVLENEVK